ncbi:MAG TPA: SPOR domain-containing protein [bacterium]|nr:SPOR domain-containing protein [bacterium]
MAEPARSGAGKKFSITIQVPEDITAQWPDRATAEKLVQEVYTAMGTSSTPPPKASPQIAVPPQGVTPPLRRGIAGVVLAALVAGGVGGYLGARFYLGPMADRTVVTAPARAEPSPSSASAIPSGPADQPLTSASPAAQAPAAQPAEPAADSRPVASAPAAYNIQVGAYKIRENAEVLLQRLQQDGFQAQIVRSGGLYVVQLGPLQSLPDAGRLVEKLKEHQYDAVVLRITSAGH